MFGASTGVPDVFGFILTVVAAIVLIAAWVILAGSRFIQGGVVERPERVPQLYGYTVCLIALVWALTSTVSLAGNLLSMSAPEMRESDMYGWEPSVTSFEAFRTTYDRSRMLNAGDPRDVKLDSVPEAELRRRYEALRADRIARARFDTRRGLIIDTLSLLGAAALFAFHWRWVRRHGLTSGASTAIRATAT
jgi:hypothetical protein